jgi:hypothetical protein
VETRHPGRFNTELRLYTDCPEKPEIKLKINGHIDGKAGRL